MALLPIIAAAALLQPSAPLCVAAYAVDLARRDPAGGLVKPSVEALAAMTPRERAAIFRLVSDGRAWMALATRTPGGMAATTSALQTLATSPERLRAANAVCRRIKLGDLPKLPPPPTPQGQEEACWDASLKVHALIRACAPLDQIASEAHAQQSELEQGRLSCRSSQQAREIWISMGADAAAAAASQTHAAQCSAPHDAPPPASR